MNLKSLNYIDVHAHVNFAAFDHDRDEVLKRAHEAGVMVVNVGTQKDTSLKAIELAEKYEGVYAIIGLHPIHTSKSFHDTKELGEEGKAFTSRGEDFDTTIYRSMAKHEKVVAIGECGLDYFRSKIEDSSWQEEFRKQEEAFRTQVELAIEVNKPLMLHVRSGGGRSAYLDTLQILKSYNLNLKSPVRGNFHFFAGSTDELREILDAGLTVSFTGVITFAREYAELVKFAPLDRILSETDCPYVTPAPHRGKRNEPLYVTEVVKTIASIRKESHEMVAAQLMQNAEEFFSLR